MEKWIITVLLCISSKFYSQSIGLTEYTNDNLKDGYVLFSPISSTKSYLIDKCGNEVHSWQSTYKPALSSYILTDGTLLRTGNTNNSTFNAGGKGGQIEKFDWNGNIVWSYTISSNFECQHHDVKGLPNGNVLVLVWEVKTNIEAIDEGRDPTLVSSTLWSEKIVEIEPFGLNGGTIVWEWKLWDHLIQDYDSSKNNFGNVSEHPELIDINYNASSSNPDWIHFNSIDYNEQLDQILLSSHGMSEIWIIDHSTTSSQAASHLGGNSTKGGDILYRWGNPLAYSIAGDQVFFGQHSAYWIESTYPFGDKIMVFNHGNGRVGENYSTVEIIETPVNGFGYILSLPYLPVTNSWILNENNTLNFYAQNISGAQQLSNGNVLVCDGPNGVFREYSTTNEIVWEYVNPVSNTGILTQGSTPNANLVFRANFYPETYTGFIGLEISSIGLIENNNTLSTQCELSLNLDENQFLSCIYPNPIEDNFILKINQVNHFNKINFELTDYEGKDCSSMLNADFSSLPLIYFKLGNSKAGIYFLKINTENHQSIHKLVITK